MQERVNKLRELFSGEGIDAFLVTSPENRFYLTGFTGSSGSVLITDREIFLITDFRYDEQAKKQCPHCTVVMAREGIPEALQELVQNINIRILGCEGEIITYQQYTSLEEKLAAQKIKPLYGFMDSLRAVKDHDEIECIARAVELTDRAFSHVLPFIRDGVTENSLALELEFFMRKNGAEGIAFPFIVASGQRSSLPHGTATEKIISGGDLVTLDFGASLAGYNSDMTRTVVVGKADDQQKKIYSIVLEAQLAGIRAVRPGVAASEVDRAARDVIAGHGYGECFGHSTGHGLGLKIHENPRLSVKDDTELKPGMVVTVEPGIYLPGWGGVRIEDSVLVESHGVRVLSTSEKDRLLVCGL
ncbi:MAG: Xaa-Pro dipeptidase [Peptococcaceae bacterium BICA1-7]|nr:MAG: Xaa-Pro dipeptidase [Peptococcaceae bacterium BICA1-7]HBV96821.1 aminopeptidase P family protein [Desulfotomaculum sp.]